MHIPKKYGQSRIDSCPFCQKQSVAVNKQGVPVCLLHKDSVLANLKCVCGEYVDIKSGKFGSFAACINCGNVNMKKILEVNRA